MTTETPDTFLDQEYNDADTQNFFDNKGEVGESETNADDANTLEEIDNSSTEEKKSSAREDTKNDNDGGDDESSEEDEGAAGDKSLSEQERFKAMAAEERNRRREFQKQIDTLKQENEQLKGTFNKILSKAEEQAKAEADKANIPNFEDDPIGAMKYENEQLKKQLNDFQKGYQDKQQQEQQQRALSESQNRFLSTYRAKADEFTKTQPDFNDAYQHLLASREQEHKLAGFSDAQVKELLMEDEAAVVANALQNGQNPAKILYDMAKLRGYQGKGNINPQQKMKENQEKIENLEKGMRASKSVNSGGVNAKDSLTLEDVANMSDEEIDQVDWNKLMKSG